MNTDKKKEFLKKKFWLKRYDKFKEEIFDESFISRTNSINLQDNNTIFDLREYLKDGYKLGEEVIMDILERFYTFEYRPFIRRDGRTISMDDYEGFIRNMGFKWIRNNKNQTEYRCSYGVVKKRCNIKTYPTKIEAYKNEGDRFNRYIETSLYIGEGVIILKESRDREWFLVISKDYIGWASKENIEECTRKQLEKYLQGEFILSLHDGNSIKINGVQNKVPLGSKVGILVERENDYLGYIPYLQNGLEKEREFPIEKSKTYSKGYLKFTIKNTLDLAFEMLHDRYSWGGENENRDCSLYVRDIYACFGLILPRNAGDQSRVLNIEKLALGEMDREEMIHELNMNSICLPIYMEGHVMIYLGEAESEGYIIHDSGGYYKGGVKVGESKVLVSDIDIETSKGKVYYKEFTSAFIKGK